MFAWRPYVRLPSGVRYLTGAGTVKATSCFFSAALSGIAFVTRNAFASAIALGNAALRSVRRRNSVSLVANTLQQANFIHYSRGHIEITNLDGLIKTSCECYGMVKAQYTRLLRPRIHCVAA